jgi:hypothetical protein
LGTKIFFLRKFLLYKIIKTFEHSDDFDEFKLEREKKERKKEDWIRFINKFARCLADTPIGSIGVGAYPECR